MIEGKEYTYEEARELKDSLDILFKSLGWKFVMEFIKERTEIREKQLIEQCPMEIKEMVAFARLKGGIEELKLFPIMFEQIYEEVDSIVHDDEYEQMEMNYG